MSVTPLFEFTELVAQPNQPEITVNDWLNKMEAIMGRVLSRTTAAEPGSPAEGDAYILPASATGTDWATFAEHDIAHYINGAWANYTPKEGWGPLWVNDENIRVDFSGATWDQTTAVAPIGDFKNSVRMAATGNVTLSGLQTLDGVVGVVDDRVFLPSQTTGSENGIYLMKSGAWVRTTDFDEDAEVTAGCIVPIEEGTTYADQIWILATNNPIVVGTTALTFSQIAAGGGEANTASNVGAGGIGVFKQKTGSNLEFKNINVGSGIIITDDVANDEIDIGVDNTVVATLTDNQTLTNKTIDGADNTIIDVDSALAIHHHVRKSTAGSIPAGRPVYVTGYNVSGYVEVEEADASDPAKMPAIGLTDEVVTNTAIGHVTQVGRVTDLDTSAYTEQDILYVASGGGLTVTKPTGTNLIQKIALVARSHASAGIIYCDPGRQNDIPNLANDKVWLGNGSGVPVETDLGTAIESAGAVMEADSTTAAMGFVIDEDTMVSDLATKVPTQQSVKAYVDMAVASQVLYKGGYDAATNTPNLDSSPSGIEIGFMYTVTAAGTFFTIDVEIGDVLICEQDNPTLEAHWTIVNKDLNAASLKASYESNADTNAYTDAEKTKLAGVESGATADQTGAEIKSAYEAEADTNAFTDAEKTKLTGIEATADVTDSANVAAAGAVMDSDITASEGLIRKTGAGTYEAIKTNLGATTNPGVSDDGTSGYGIGSRWINTTSDTEYVCLDASTGAAVWIRTTANDIVLQTTATQLVAADSTTYYGGFIGYFLVADYQGISIPRGGVIKTIYLNIFNSVLGSSETSSIYFRLNDTTDTLISSAVDNSTSSQKLSATGLSITVDAGDTFEIKWITPAWVTNPTAYIQAIIYIE